MLYREIDWPELWRQERQQKSRPRRSRHDWDRRAADFAARNHDSPFTEKFLALFDWQPHWRVLDVGCGPGTLALPLARRVAAVTALDYAAGMLTELQKQQQQQGLDNITAIQAAWEDDWQQLGITPHEVLIAARSLAVDDLPAALDKIQQWTSRLAIIVDRVGAGPFDPELFAAVGRPFAPGPDYIITVNMLYSMGINATVEFIELDHQRLFADRQQALASKLWMLHDPTPEEMEKLGHYLDSRLHWLPDGRCRLERSRPSRWAVISWAPPAHSNLHS
ncbi:MAG: class I SAM-dependent methyltransferase [Desulfurivibrio sp.]|nr:class I SAM-dependent methyltransferase [Desulfurivibrio sp.]